MVVLCAFLCAACYFDYRYRRVPNWLIAGALGYGLIHAIGAGGVPRALGSVFETALVVLAFYPLFRIGTLGGGDVKLFGVCAGYLPGSKILLFLFFSLLFAAIHSLLHFIREPDIKERFCYLVEYLREVAESGKWKLYWADKQEQRRRGICLAGPIFASILLYLGGVY